MHVDAEGGHFDLILVEALDRHGRKLVRTADLYDRLSIPEASCTPPRPSRVIAMHVGALGAIAPDAPRVRIPLAPV